MCIKNVTVLVKMRYTPEQGENGNAGAENSELSTIIWFKKPKIQSFAQSYPHYPQKISWLKWYCGKNQVRNFVLLRMDKLIKNHKKMKKTIDKRIDGKLIILVAKIRKYDII